MEFKITAGAYNISLTSPACCIGTTTGPTIPPVKIDPRNAINPYDEIGQAHNDALVALDEKIGDAEISEPELVKMVVQYLQNYPFKNAEIKAIVDKTGPDIIDCFGGWSFKAGVAFLNANQPEATTQATQALIDRAKGAGLRLAELGTRLVAFDNRKETSLGLVNFYKELDKAALEAKLKDEDRNAVLAMLAVGRYSTAFWAQQVGIAAAMTSGPGKSDLLGAASGAAAGVVTGAGVVVCAAVGGICRSLGYWFTSKRNG
jgi:hypothetical protein